MSIRFAQFVGGFKLFCYLQTFGSLFVLSLFQFLIFFDVLWR